MTAIAATLTDDAPISLGTLADRWLRDHGIATPGGEGEMIAAEFRPDGLYETWVTAPDGYSSKTLAQLASALRKRPEVIDVTPVAEGVRATLRFNASAAAKRIGGSRDEALKAGAEWLAETYPTFAPPLEPIVDVTRDGFAVIRKLVTAQAGGVSLEGLGNALDAAGWRHRVVVAAWPMDPYRAVKGLWGAGAQGRFHVRAEDPQAREIPLGTPDVAVGAYVNVEPGTVIFSGTREVIDDKRAPKGFGLGGYGDRQIIGAILRALESVEIMAPDGRIIAVPIERPRRGGALVGRDALDWLTAQGFAEVAERIYAALGKRVRARLSRPRGFGAECQWCENEQCLRGGTLVDHGYRYPQATGWRGGELGERVGSCIGVGREPYERSCDLLVEQLPGLVRAEADKRRAMDDTVQHIANHRAVDVPESWVREGGSKDRSVSIFHGHPLWERASEVLIGQGHAAWRAAKNEADWCSRRIDRWTLRPIPTETAPAPMRRRR